MMVKITLVLFDEINPLLWNLGDKISIKYTTESLQKAKKKILNEAADCILFWDAKNTLPTELQLKNVLASKGDMWHVGPKLGLENAPLFLDSIQPTSMLHVVSDKSIDHSSWKNSFKGCLIKKNVFEEIPLADYSNSLDVIGLDFGYKAVKSGVFTRYSTILSENIDTQIIDFSSKEQLQFIKQNFDKKGFVWTYLSNIFQINPLFFIKVLKSKKQHKPIVFQQKIIPNILQNQDLSVSVVIATLERYPFLKKELKELRALEIPLKEIIIVDQTPEKNRESDFLNDFADLPIVYLESDIIGQCTARNLGIEKATSKFVWFLDDDMEEIPSNYLQKHLETLYSFNVDISCGIPDEIGTNYLDRTKSIIELAEGFPTNDVLVNRSLLKKVGGFDTKMDQKQSEDQEIGLRCVKLGALSVKNNQLRIVHLRASRGGLRNHNVRKITFASSRNSVFQRRFLHHSEIYLNLKHFNKNQVYKSLLLNIRGTFIVRGGILKKTVKIVVGIVLLPHTVYVINKNYKRAKNMLNG